MLAQYVILGLLMEGPKHGYEIKRQIEKLSGLFWKVSYGSLYPALRKLADNGCISTNQGGNRNAPRRKTFRLTEKGEAVLRAWLLDTETASRVDRNTTNEFMLKFVFFGYLSGQERDNLIASRLKQLHKKLDEMRERSEKIKNSEGKPGFYAWAMRDLIIRSVTLECEWLKSVRRNSAAGAREPRQREEEGGIGIGG